MFSGILSSYFYLSHSTTVLTQQTSIINAERYLHALTAFRTLYTKEVVNTAEQQNITISHDYKNIKNAIPLPATLSMALGKEIGKHQSGAKTYLYSRYPFPWRKQENKTIFVDDFSQQAWESLTKKPTVPFYRFESVDGELSIRYAVADVMREGCISCHNTHPDTPKNDWQEGDVRGVMEVILPISKTQQQAQTSLQNTFIVLTGMIILLIIILFIFFTRIKKDANKLFRSNEKLKSNQQQIKVANKEITNAYDALQVQTDELIKSNQIKSDFLATMSHEIRTPLNGVVGMLNLLEKSQMNAEQEHHTYLATTSANTLMSIINDILDFSKIEADKLSIESVEINLPDLIGNLASTMAQKAHEKGIELIVDLASLEQTFVKGDPSRIRQILANLISNAIKFTESGEVKISANSENLGDKKLCFHCSVSDSGIGIAKNKLDEMFNRFTQADTSTTRRYGGTGLGLAIVRKLCQLMGGEIRVASEQGKGSVFSFTLQLEACEQLDINLPTRDVKQRNILIVDDNKTNRELLVGQLALWGANVIAADSAESALKCLSENLTKQADERFEIAILDMQMPEIDGGQLGEMIRADSQWQGLKLLMLTSLGQQEDAKYFAEIGFDCYLSKPVMEKELFNALAILIDGGEALNRATPLVTGRHIKQLKRNSLPSDTRILLVEDNSINQVVAQSMLANLGVKADIANNGEVAIAYLEKQAYDVVLMDCQMPIMDGYQATQKIRQSDTDYQDIHIIAMTANAMIGDKEKCLSAGMNEYLTKPIKVDALEHCLLAALQLRPVEELNHDAIDENEVLLDKNKVWNQAEFFRRVSLNEKLAERIVRVFCQDMPEEISQLKSAVTALNFQEIETLTHKIKGSSANIEAILLFEWTLSLEGAAKQKNAEECPIFFKKLNDNFEKLLLELQQFLQ